MRGKLHSPLRLTPVPWTWAPSIQIAAATGLPLAAGMAHGTPLLALIGSIAGFLLVLTDPGGRTGYRLLIQLATAGTMAGAFLLGQATHSHPVLFYLVAAALSYWIALMGTRGAELERAILFGLFHFLAARYIAVPDAALPLLIRYGAYALAVSCALVVLLPRPAAPNAPLLPTLLRESLARDRAAHFYALGFAITLMATLLFVDLTRFERGYWIAGTVLLLIRPDSAQSLHRIYQRFFGTFVGLMLAIALIYTLHSPWALLAVITASSFLTPWALARNHWLGTVFVTVMISLMFDLLDPTTGDFHTPWLRFEATAIACLFALAGEGIRFLFDARRVKREA